MMECEPLLQLYLLVYFVITNNLLISYNSKHLHINGNYEYCH